MEDIVIKQSQSRPSVWDIPHCKAIEDMLVKAEERARAETIQKLREERQQRQQRQCEDNHTDADYTLSRRNEDFYDASVSKINTTAADYSKSHPHSGKGKSL